MPVFFQTARDVPEDTVCRTFKIPASPEWLGIFNMLRKIMLSRYNWEQVSEEFLTIEETLPIIEALFNEYWETPGCGEPDACLQPDGSRIIRLSPTGHFQQLEGGVWVAPTGDYAVPPVPAREEPTAYSRRCAAAANAESVLAQTYEILSDEIAAGTAAAEAIAAMITGLAGLIGLFIAFPALALVGLAAAVIVVLTEVVEYTLSDLWDVEFSEKLKCLLFECSTDTGGVVTFDFACVNEGLTRQVDLLSPTADIQLRLFGQVSYMLQIIGVDGLNAAGATTGVVDANCDECVGWCYEWDFADGQGIWQPVEAAGGVPLAIWDSDKWGRIYNRGGGGISETRIICGISEAPFTITGIEVYYEVSTSTGTNWYVGEPLTEIMAGTVEADTECRGITVTATINDGLRIDFGVVGNERIDIKSVRVYGAGGNPFGADNFDCETCTD